MAESSLSRSNIRRISPVRDGGTSGSNIPTVQERRRADQAAETIQRGILESRRRQMVDEARKAAAPTGRTGDEKYTQIPMTPEQERRILNSATTTSAATSTAPASNQGTWVYDGTRSTYTPPPGTNAHAGIPSTSKSTPTVPPLLARPQPAAPARQGMIDGRPANRVIADMEGNAQARGNFGADIANRNIEKMGVQGAVADYFERNRLDKDRNSLPVNEPGNVQEWIQSKRAEVGVTAPSVAGPAQRAMLESRARREQRVKDDSDKQYNYDMLRARHNVDNISAKIGHNGRTPEEAAKINLNYADEWDRATAEGRGFGSPNERKYISEALRSDPTNPSSYFKDFTGESDQYNKETGARGLAGARADAKGSSVMMTPTAGALLRNWNLALRSEDYVRAATNRVDKPFQLSKTDRLGGYKRVGIAEPDVSYASTMALIADYKKRKAQREASQSQSEPQSNDSGSQPSNAAP